MKLHEPTVVFIQDYLANKPKCQTATEHLRSLRTHTRLYSETVREGVRSANHNFGPSLADTIRWEAPRGNGNIRGIIGCLFIAPLLYALLWAAMAVLS